MKKGFVNLLALVIVGAIGLSTITSISILAIARYQADTANETGMIARSTTDACAEEALQTIYENNSFVGTSTVTIAGADCAFTIQNTGGETRTVWATSTYKTYVRRVLITISQITPQITLTDWTETADF